MQALKNILITLGILSILLFIALLLIGIKVVSIIFVYIVGALATISLFGFVIYFIGKRSGKSESEKQE